MSGPVLAFDIHATRGAKLTRISSAPAANVIAAVRPVADPVADPVAAPAAEVTADPFTPKARSRAELAAIYGGFLGVDLARVDLLERMAVTGGDEITPEVIAGALSAAGLTTKILRPAALTPALWPELCEMTSGQVVLVIEQCKTALFIYDTTCPGNRAEV